MSLSKKNLFGRHHAHLTLGMFFLIGSGITATFLSSITLRNHDNFVRCKRIYIQATVLYMVLMD